jgi:uncharacterized protein YecE (DUF72 family)
MTKPVANIRIGIGGWTYQPWRGVFYPKGLAQTRELAYASERLTSIEINGTFYGSQKPESFAKWREETPDDFIFSVKGPRFATNRRQLSQASQSIERFLTGGVTELRHKLGPINWQFAATKSFDPTDFEAFLKLLPQRVDGLTIRHAVEVRHESFKAPEFIGLARDYGAAIVIAGDSNYPQIGDSTAAFVYARIMGTVEEASAGYFDHDLDKWVDRARLWASGAMPDGIETVMAAPAANKPRDVFLYVIGGFKERNAAAATAMIERLK